MSVARSTVAAAFAAVLFSAAPVYGEYSPYAGPEYPREVYWGDTHVHTSFSLDANATGRMDVTPEDAYRFARGETVISQHGLEVRMRRPLDFLVVADHAEYLGLIPRLEQADPLLLSTETGRRWHALRRAEPQEHFSSPADASQFLREVLVKSFPLKPLFRDREFEQSVWNEVVANAERFNEPGRFTAFAGYEWSSHPQIDNLHRVVIFADGPERTRRVIPFSAFDSPDPRDLWNYLADYEEETGGGAIAIPHNPNASNGRMFSLETFTGEPMTGDYARRRARWEPLLEVTQIKGDSETHPALSPDDAFADYETWDKGNLLFSKRKQPWMLKHEYARSALKLGLQQEEELGVNPFKFGMIGSSDSHTGLAAVGEDNFWGKVGSSEPKPERWKGYFFKGEEVSVRNWRLAASGYAAVWARENSREAIFAAMKRRETYATTGPRMRVRFFGGWEFVLDDAHRPDLAKTGYAKGVPMGADLGANPEDRAPSFLVLALKDPDGANLDRIQIVKGWRTADGELREKVYEVAHSDPARRTPDGSVQTVGNTVDIERASYTNAIGTPQLAAVWQDPDFDVTQRAFYYARVIQIPTPRWTAYDAEYFGVDMSDEVPMITRERAYTSSIWYTP